MKKIKLILMLIMFCFILNIDKVKAVEELPDNGGKISSSQIIQTKTGTGPFDENDEPGNDSSEDNNIVRSFDQVTWTVENTMILNGDSADGYSGGTILVKLTLPESAKGLMEWNKDAMGWTDGTGKVSDDGLTFTGEYRMSKDNVTVPGKQTLVFVLNVYGATNGYEIQPNFEIYLNGNSNEEKINLKPEKIIVSSSPSYNLRLLKRDLRRFDSVSDDNGNNVEGIVYGYYAVLQLYNPNSSKQMKGVEYPKGDITFDLKLDLDKYDKSGNLIEDITDTHTPLIYNYSVNGKDGNTNVFYKDRTFYSFIQEGYIPYSGRPKYEKASETQREMYIYDSGNMIMEQEGDVIHVTVKNYEFDGYFPKRNTGTTTGTINYTPNIGCFSTLLFQILVPINEDNVDENCNYYFTIEDENLNANSISGINFTNQVITNDDSRRSQVEVFTKGSYYKHHRFYDSNLRCLHTTAWNSGDTYASNGQNIYLAQMVCQGRTNDPIQHAVYGGNVLIKIDTRGFEVLPELNGNKFRVDSGWFTFDIYYAAKRDGTAWRDLNEQDDAKIEDLVYYKTLDELKVDGKICVGALFENNGGVFKTAENQNSNLDRHIYLPVKIKDEAIIGETYQFTSDVRLYKTALDRTKESMIVENGAYTTEPLYSSYNNNYIKTEYDENDQIISGTHSSSGAGNAILVVGALSGITNDVNTLTSDSQKKINYDLSRNENEVEYKLTPTLSNNYNKTQITGVTIEVLDTLPAGMTYKPGSSNYGEPEIISNSDGTTTLKWTINNCTVNEPITPVIFKVILDEELSNGVQLETKAVIRTDLDSRTEKYRRETESIQITNLSSHRLYKSVETPVIEKNGEIHYTVSYKNNTDEIIRDFQLLDILPYNGDSRGTEYTGEYTLDRLVVTQKDGAGETISNDNLEILYTNDESVRNGVTSKDENLGAGWNSVNSETIKQKATAYAVKGEIGAQGSVTVDIYLKTNGNKGLDKYVNSATAQVYKETEEMVTSNVVSQVVERKIEGIAWEDSNRNGVKDEGEQVLSNVEINLTDELGQQVTDVNGNKVTSIKTDENGYYKFENLPKGEYYVQVKIPNEKYELTEKQVGTNNEINSKFNEEEKETDKIEGLNSIDLPELTVSYVNAGFVKIEGSIEITKVDKEDNSKLIEGATFKVEKLDEEGNVDSTYNIEEQTTGEEGKVLFEGLEVGKYRVTETKAPSGYELLEKSIEVEITGENRDIKLTAENELKLILPLTGDTNNTIGLIIIGAIMIGISVILFVKYEGKVLIEKV